MKVTVFGTGYVGLVQGAVLADVGHDVICVDVDAAKVAALQAGRPAKPWPRHRIQAGRVPVRSGWLAMQGPRI